MSLEFSKHTKNATALSKQRKKVESQGMKGIPSLKRNTIPNGKIIGSILILTRKRGTSQRTLASFFITEITIGNIVLTIPIPRTSKAKQETGRKRRKIKKTEGLEKIDGESLTSTEEFRMIIGISDSSDSDEIKHSEDNTSNASHMITTKRTKKKTPDTKRERKILKTF